MKQNRAERIRTILFPLGVGLVSSLLTRGAMGRFAELEKPPLTPPAWLFPVVWTVFYTLMGLSANRIKMSGKDSEEVLGVLKIYYYQLAVNFLWPTFFFNFGWYLFSFFWLLLLWILVVWMIREFAKISRPAAYWNIPYLLWLTIAAYLNFGVWWLNR